MTASASARPPRRDPRHSQDTLPTLRSKMGKSWRAEPHSFSSGGEQERPRDLPTPPTRLGSRQPRAAEHVSCSERNSTPFSTASRGTGGGGLSLRVFAYVILPRPEAHARGRERRCLPYIEEDASTAAPPQPTPFLVRSLSDAGGETFSHKSSPSLSFPLSGCLSPSLLFSLSLSRTPSHCGLTLDFLLHAAVG